MPEINEGNNGAVHGPIRIENVDYKDVRYLTRFLSERGKIIPSRISLQPLKRQRELAVAIKRARILALIPFVSR
jgi:ribosomal protein S18